MTTFINKIKSQTTGALTAAGVALAAMTLPAVPAQASDDALIKFLLGAAAVAIVIHAARSDGGSRQDHMRQSSRALPTDCQETWTVRHRNIALYNAQCLRNAGLRNLPRQCLETRRTDRGQRSVYRAACLYDAGYTAERRAPNWGRDRYQPMPPRGGGGGNWQGRSILPQHCVVTYRYGGQTLVGYQRACLEQRGIRDLPRTCQVRSTSSMIYSAHCLTERGYPSRG